MKFQAGTQTIQSKFTHKFLGVIIDQKLNLKPHVECAGTKAYNTGTLIARMLQNTRIGGFLFISKVISSILLRPNPVVDIESILVIFSYTQNLKKWFNILGKNERKINFFSNETFVDKRINSFMMDLLKIISDDRG